MDIQAKIPPALCALHNFIRCHDPTDIADFDDEPLDGVGLELRLGELGEYGDLGEYGELSTSSGGVPDRDTAMTTRDQIANDMWDQYQQGLQSS